MKMIGSRPLLTKDMDHDEGELDSEQDSKSSSSEGYTSDGGSESDSNGRCDSPSPPADETPWERGLRLARERSRRSKLLRESDADLENKKFNLTVVAPDLTEDGAFADISDVGRSNPADIFWTNYHKLSIIGSNQLTCKRALPCDLDPPSLRTIAQWRKSLKKHRHRSSSVSSSSSIPSSVKSYPSASSVSSNFGSRSSSLSSIAGSLYQAVPDLLLGVDSDGENSRRRRRKRSGSDTLSSTSSRSSLRSMSRSSSSKPVPQKAVKRVRESYSASSRSISSSHSPRNHGSLGRRGSFNRGRRGGGVVSYGDQPQQRQPPISGYHYQQTSFNRGGSFRDGDNGPNYGDRRGYGEPVRWREPSDRASEHPPLMSTERPLKRPWAAEPPRQQRGLDRHRSPPLRSTPPPPQQHQKLRRSRSISNEESENKSNYGNTSWTQSRSRQLAPTSKVLPPSSNQADRNPVRSNLDSSPRKRSVPGPAPRRKSRSPFADSYFSNPPPPSSTQPVTSGDNSMASSIPFEQTVPLLAGAVNPAAPTNPSRPGVKLTIAPRIRVGGNALIERPAPTTAPSTNYLRMAEGSPVSSTSSSPQAVDRCRNNSPRRQGASGYTAVSPGGFDSPPPSKSQQHHRHISKVRGFDQRDDQSRMRGRGGHGDYGRDRDDRRSKGDFHTDRFSRGGGQSDRSRERRPPLPSSNDRFDRRSGGAMNDRSREYGGDYQYGRSRGGRMDSDRGFDRGRHDIDRRRRDIDRRGGGARDRSRSPFENRRRRDRDTGRDAASLSSKEARLDELRKRLAVLDDKITELGGGSR